MKRNKRGYVQDWLFFGVMILIIAVVFLFMTKFVGEFDTKFQASDMSSEAKAISTDNETRWAPVFDNIFIFVFFGFALAIIGGFYVLDTHPALVIPIFIVLGFIMFVLAIMGNVFDEVRTDPALSTESGKMDAQEWIMGHIVVIVVVVAILGVIVLFAKFNWGGG